MSCHLSPACVVELCGAFVVAFGEFQMMNSKFASLVTTFWPIYPANTLVVTGTIVTCVCYVGVLGSMRENRCMIISVSVIFLQMLAVTNDTAVVVSDSHHVCSLSSFLSCCLS